MPVSILVPVSNKQSTGVDRGDTLPQNRFISQFNMPTQDSSIGKSRIAPYDRQLGSGPNAFSSIISQTSIQDTDLPCEGVNLDIGIVRSRFKPINNIPNFAGVYPQPITARGPGVGLAVDIKQLDDLNNKVLRPANTFNMFMSPPFRAPGVY